MHQLRNSKINVSSNEDTYPKTTKQSNHVTQHQKNEQQVLAQYNQNHKDQQVAPTLKDTNKIDKAQKQPSKATTQNRTVSTLNKVEVSKHHTTPTLNT